MYNRYIPDESSYAPIHSAFGKEQGQPEGRGAKWERTEWKDPLRGAVVPHMDKNAGIAGILKALKLEQLDRGDLLLITILLLLLLEGDNIELVITLGLLLLLGLGEEQEDQKE